MHDIPKKAVKHLSQLPKFNGEGETFTFIHIKSHELKFGLLNNLEENVRCRLFTPTFEEDI
jgi:hypothetical protein